MKIDVLQGESEFAFENFFVGGFRYNVKPAPARQEKVDVTFIINQNGLLQVSAKDVRTNKQKKITFSREQLNLSKQKIKDLAKKSKKARKLYEGILD